MPSRPKKAKKAVEAAAPKVKFCKTLDCSKPAEVRGHCRLHFLKVLSGKGEGSGEASGKLSVVGGDRRKGNRYQAPAEDTSTQADFVAADKAEALQIDNEDVLTDAETVLKDFGYDDTGT